MLKIGKDFMFEDDWSGRRSCLMYSKCDEDEPASWSIDIGFASGDFYGEEIMPSLCVNPIDTDKESSAELVGESFSVDSIDEICEREDSFYIYEHEPLVSYCVEVLAVENDRAHIRCGGILVVDGYADPYTTDTFEIDSWIPVIESAADWEKFGL